MRQRSQVFALRGGLDLVSPAMLIPPGFAVACKNYEADARGYVRSTGYERFDGRASPTAAGYWIITFTGGTAEIAAGSTINGQTSGATAIVLDEAVLTSGSYAAGTAAGFLPVVAISLVFNPAENIREGVTVRAVTSGEARQNDASTDALDMAYRAAALTHYRALIDPPPGGGPIRGIATFQGVTYCWRDNAGATAGVMWAALTSGWTEMVPGRLLHFRSPSAAIAIGATLTGGTSGTTGTVSDVVLAGGSGAWDASGHGYVLLSSASGAFTNGETITHAGGTFLAVGTGAVMALPPGGKYRAIEQNFYGSATGNRLYVTNGVGRAFEFDGELFRPILTGLDAGSGGIGYASPYSGLLANLDKPTYVASHKLHLFLGFGTGSVQNSSTGEPLIWVASTGAAEIATGQEITGLKSDTHDSMVITGRNRIAYLTGSDSTDFTLRSISESSGAEHDTLEVAGSPIFLDRIGLRDLQTAQTYGNWNIGTITQMVEPMLSEKRAAGLTVVGAMRVRARDQYRLFYNDGSGITVYLGRKSPEITTFDLGFPVNCVASGTDLLGNEVLYVGASPRNADDVCVYRIDIGTSFDGAAIEAFLRLAFVNQGAPNVLKRYHRARIEGRGGSAQSVLGILADYSYGDDDAPVSPEYSAVLGGNGGFWDVDFLDRFYWSAAVEGQFFADLDGIGENIAVTVASQSATESAHALSALTINFTPRRTLR